MAKRLLEYDKLNQVATFHEYDQQTKVTTIETVQDAAPFLEANKRTMTAEPGGAMGLNARSKRQIQNGWWHVASIPIGVQMKWMTEYGVDIFNEDHAKRVKKLLNDPEWAYLRTNPGKV